MAFYLSRKLFIVASRDYALLFVDPVLFCFFICWEESVVKQRAPIQHHLNTVTVAHTHTQSSFAICCQRLCCLVQRDNSVATQYIVKYRILRFFVYRWFVFGTFPGQSFCSNLKTFLLGSFVAFVFRRRHIALSFNTSASTNSFIINGIFRRVSRMESTLCDNCALHYVRDAVNTHI